MDNPDTKCYISDDTVVSLDSSGTVTALKAGTAYVAIVASDNVYQVYCYHVNGESNTNNNVIVNNDKTNNLTQSNPSNSLLNNENISGADSSIKNTFSFVGIGSIAVLILVVLAFILIIASFIKSKALDNAMQNIASNPCQETTLAAINEFTDINPIVRINLSMGSDSRGVHFSLWRSIFNNVVIPSSQIPLENKEALKQALIKLNTHSLHPVVSVQASTEAKEAFGAGGEDNVWHNLKVLHDCDIYRNVRINNSNTSSEIDAVIVDEKRGIFLLEVKCIGGERKTDNHKYISYNALKEDPTNQILRHQYDFAAYFKTLDIGNKIKNTLVFSWPNEEERRIVDIDSFTQMPYDVISVEQLLGYYQNQSHATITHEERKIIAAKLISCSKEHITH